MVEDPPWTSVLETRFGMGLEGAAGKDMVYTFATSLPLAIVMARVEETAAAHMPQWQVRKRTVVVRRKVQLKTLVRDVKGNLLGKTVPVKKTILLVKFHIGGELVMTFKTEAAKGADSSDTSLHASPSGGPTPGIPSPLQSNADFLDDANTSGGAALSHPTLTSAQSVGPGWTEFTRVTLQTKGQHHFTTGFVKFVLCIRSRSHTLRLYNDACKHIHHSVAVYPSEVPKATIW
eukprot:TRINITY_DN2935_c0_g1_i1.p2 TRINITY_DN2935_c0_g1~~TRINITY_DN2935_c0_g1_i1.p2  ORF type:complete len:233 (+),score=86.02 TRINITY_DN2935_c0_g1_i1:607-1305(+)